MALPTEPQSSPKHLCIVLLLSNPHPLLLFNPNAPLRPFSSVSPLSPLQNPNPPPPPQPPPIPPPQAPPPPPHQTSPWPSPRRPQAQTTKCGGICTPCCWRRRCGRGRWCAGTAGTSTGSRRELRISCCRVIWVSLNFTVVLVLVLVLGDRADAR